MKETPWEHLSPEERILQAGGTIEPYKPKEAARRPKIYNARDNNKEEFPEIKRIAPYLPPGLTLLAGAPKLGKSWLALQWAYGITAGAEVLGGPCTPGEVLYLDLEGNPRRIQKRLRMLYGDSPMPASLHVSHDWPRFHEGGIDEIRAWMAKHKKTVLIIVDVLTAFRKPVGGREQPFAADYEAVRALQQLSEELKVAILVIHHTRKSPADTDPFEAVSGTMGLTAAADSVLVLRKGNEGTTLYSRGRDIEESEIAVTFDVNQQGWFIQGDPASVNRSKSRNAILQVLEEASDPLGPREIADAAGMKESVVKVRLPGMVSAGEVTKLKRGTYWLPHRIVPPEAADYRAARDSLM